MVGILEKETANFSALSRINFDDDDLNKPSNSFARRALQKTFTDKATVRKIT